MRTALRPPRRRLPFVRATAVAGLFSLWPTAAWANIGIPTIIVVMPVMVLSLLPIIAIEAHAYARMLAVPGRRALRAAVVTNLLSSFIGIPVAWGLLLVAQILLGGGRSFGLETLPDRVLSFTLQAPLLVLHDDAPWLLPAAGLVLMVPFFLASWWTEYWLARRLFREVPPAAVWRAVRDANLRSYALLALWPLAGFAAL